MPSTDDLWTPESGDTSEVPYELRSDKKFLPHETEHSEFQPYDSEIPRIEWCMEKTRDTWEFKQPETLEDFVSFVLDLWYENGFDVTIDLNPGASGHLYPYVVILGRVDDEAPGEFDHERQQWEVQHDILELDQPGVIGADGRLKELPKKMSLSGSSKV